MRDNFRGTRVNSFMQAVELEYIHKKNRGE
jgi:hypothetical protein